MIEIKQIHSENDLNQCALLMSQSEPWITLQMDYKKCLQALEGDFKEVYVVTDANKFPIIDFCQIREFSIHILY